MVAHPTRSAAALSRSGRIRTQATSNEQPATTNMTSPQRWTLFTVCLATFMYLLDITVVNVALPDIQRELHASLSDLQWVVDAYALMLAALLLTAGSLADLLGRRIVFATGIAIFTAGLPLWGGAANGGLFFL